MSMSFQVSTAVGAVVLTSSAMAFGGGVDRLRDALLETSSATTIKVGITHSNSMTMGDVTQDSENVYVLSLVQPDRLALRLTEGDEGGTIISDGTTLTYYMPTLKRYTEGKSPDALAKILNPSTAAELGIIDNGPLGFLSAVLLPEATKAMTDRFNGDLVVDVIEEGEHLIHLRVHLFAKDFPGLDNPMMGIDTAKVKVPIDFWVTTEGAPRIHKMQPQFDGLMEAMAENFKEMMGGDEQPMPKLSMELMFKDWTFGGDIPVGTFAFAPPADVEKVDDMFAGSGFGEEGELAADPVEQLVGKAAPTFQLELLDGGTLDLASHAGRDVVVLDFWATWCGPCIQALPKYIKVFDDLKGRNVVFYAIDLGETNERVQAFLDKKEWNTLKVAMDREGKVADLFFVTGIPQTVIIGKDGTVEAVHVGFGTGMDKTIDEEVKKLLDGKSLSKK
jgi:thiol-disulfide isomerase/thioredoxin/outer membrane lipoprotein-sorting protein